VSVTAPPAPAAQPAPSISTPITLALLSPEGERALKPKDTFKECDKCPEMIVVPAGSFTMGSANEQEHIAGGHNSFGPQHRVKFARQFAVGEFALTFDEWDACVADGGCNGYRPGDAGWGRGRLPVINVSWDDAKAYAAWLAKKTGKPYRLLSEAEREYITRAGTTTPYWWGSSISTSQANYYGSSRTVTVDSFAPNPWGLYQVHGNVMEWVEDCYNASYAGAPTDGSAWTSGDCSRRVVRGGSWVDGWRDLSSASRDAYSTTVQSDSLGFRIGRTLVP
jgi:formylglycine-generating enzyme required for sulfatase activity